MASPQASDGVRVFRFQVPGEAQSLSLIRMLTIHLAELAGFHEEDAGKIEIAVDEACTNVIEHAFEALVPKPPIYLEVELSGRGLQMDILDQGRSFDFDAYVPPVFPDHWTEESDQGVGLYLIRRCMDEAVYTQQSDGRNRLRLVKRL